MLLVVENLLNERSVAKPNTRRYLTLDEFLGSVRRVQRAEPPKLPDASVQDDQPLPIHME
jgi:hypothetical protein